MGRGNGRGMMVYGRWEMEDGRWKRKNGVLEYWSAGIMECWNNGIDKVLNERAAFRRNSIMHSLLSEN
jgi:hypothetical protein